MVHLQPLPLIVVQGVLQLVSLLPRVPLLPHRKTLGRAGAFSRRGGAVSSGGKGRLAPSSLPQPHTYSYFGF